MPSFYQVVAQRHQESFDVDEAARLEVDSWRIHREHHHPVDGEPSAALVRPCAALLAAVHRV